MVDDVKLFATIFLNNEDGIKKDFRIFRPEYIRGSKFDDAKSRLIQDVDALNGFISCPNFYFSDGSVHLTKPNTVYSMEYIPHNTDLILPKDIQLCDWVALFYEQTTTLEVLTGDRLTKINIRGNGKRIMGLDEPLLCDMPFMSLRLTFLGDVDGWVIT